MVSQEKLRGKKNKKACVDFSVHKETLILSIKNFLTRICYYIYLFLTALGLCCCTQAFSSCGELCPLSCGERALKRVGLVIAAPWL